MQAAQRIVAEWVDYDTEIKRLWDEVNNRNITIDAEPDTTTPSKFHEICSIRYSDLNLEFGILNWIYRLFLNTKYRVLRRTLHDIIGLSDVATHDVIGLSIIIIIIIK